jgi:hypothetical protein
VVREAPKRGIPILGPVLLILAGVLFLLNTLDILPWGVWGSLWRLWPLVLIAIGLDMIFGRRNMLISLIIVLGLLAAGVAWIFASGGFEGWGVQERAALSVPMDSARSAQVDINLGTGTLRLDPLQSGSALFAEGTLQYPQRRGQPRQEVRTEGTNLILKLEQIGDGDFFSFFGENREEWDVRLARSVSTTLNLNIGAGEADVNLRDLQVSNLDLDLGAGNTDITLPASGGTRGRINVGAGNLTIYVPEGVSAVFNADTGVGNVDVDGGFSRNGDVYSLGSTTGSNRIDFDLHVGAGNVNLRTSVRLP